MRAETSKKRRRRQERRAPSRWIPLASILLIHCIHISSALSPVKTATRIRRPSPFSTTARHMVLTTPESIIEQASTQNLLDDLIDESVRTSARRPIMMQFDPSSGWIWQRWKGTVFSETWHSAVAKMAWAMIVYFIFQRKPQLTEGLAGFGTLWGQLLSVTTFTLTFFLNQSYALWRKCYALSRRLQGRLNDLGMTLAAHAARKTPASPTEPSTYTAASRQMLELMSRYIRMFNVLTYASFTRSHRPILTPRGMRRLVERGLLTAQERQVLVDAEIPATQRHNCIILWIIRAFIEARQAGHVTGGAGFENQFMEKIHVIRAQYGGIGDELQGRMPLAYAHIVQVLVDTILWMYPVMCFSTGMSPLIGVLGSGLLTMFYQGLFDLAKQFLDPYDNENYGKGDDPLCVDTLVAETNSGSVRWMYGFEEQPFSSQRLRDGELFEYLLPVRGYSVEELAEMEEERIQKEKELQEKREREEEERIQREKKEAEEVERIRLEEEELQALATNATLANITESLIEGSDAIIQEYSDSIEDDAETDSAEIDEVNEVVHKVYTLEDGTPVTLTKDTEEKVVIGEALNGMQLDMMKVNGDSPELLPNQVAENIIAATNMTIGENKPPPPAPAVDEDEDDDDNEFTLIDFEMFQELDWHDQVGEDGKEYRLSEQLADEVWEEDEKDEAPLTYEEYTERAAEIIEAAQNEIIETAEILNAIPGSETALGSKELTAKVGGTSRGPIEPPIKRSNRKEQRKKPKYDQTRLDGISQLWGLPPEDPSALEGYPEPVSLDKDEFRFEGISQLWGETPEPPDASADSTIIDSGGDFAGISQLWGDQTLVGMNGDSNPASSRGSGESGESSSLPFKIDTSVYAELEWFDEVGPDGQEYRLSQMLADEVWDDDEPVEASVEPITYEDFAKQLQDLREAARDEKLETEAILQAPPGADSWDDPHFDRRHKEKEDDTIDKAEEDDSLEALEMDSEDLYESEETKALALEEEELGVAIAENVTSSLPPKAEEPVVLEPETRSSKGEADEESDSHSTFTANDDAGQEKSEEEGEHKRQDDAINGENGEGDEETRKDQ